MTAARFWRHILAVFFPERCGLCGTAIPPETLLCQSCLEGVQRIEPPVCVHCGREKAACRCQNRRRHFERCISPFLYSGTIKQGILRLKWDNETCAVELFGSEMARCVQREYGAEAFSAIVPVPMTPQDQRARGYNQSRLLADELARRLGVPVLEALLKIQETVPQKGLDAIARTGNVLGVFDVRPEMVPEIEGRSFLLVDDLVTTGSTLDECAKMLKIYGAIRIFGVTVAATGLSNQEK